MRTLTLTLLLLLLCSSFNPGVQAEPPAVPAPANAAQPGPAAPAVHSEMDGYLFQVVLLIGSNEGRSEVEKVPRNARQALADIEDFLPYSSYRLLDVGIIRSVGDASAMLSGPQGLDYRVFFRFDRAGSDDPQQLHVTRFDLDDVTPPPKRARIGVDATGVVNMMQTSFSVAVGETIVVGSSKLNGSGEALLVLFTAIP